MILKEILKTTKIKKKECQSEANTNFARVVLFFNIKWSNDETQWATRMKNKALQCVLRNRRTYDYIHKQCGYFYFIIVFMCVCV